MDRLACLLSDAAERDEGSDGMDAVSSSNSRRAASRKSSPLSTMPFGIVQAPASRSFQNGPPGVSDEQLESGVGPPEEQEACAHVGSSRSESYVSSVSLRGLLG
jgi:hypothetical protein